MASSLVIVVAQFVLAYLAGWALLGFVEPRWAQRLAPAAPVVGVAFLVVALHAVVLVVAVKVGAWIVLAAVVGGLGYRLIAGGPVAEQVRDLASSGVRASALASFGLLGFGLALIPSVEAKAPTVLATNNHDAFFYVGAAEWSIEHPITSSPDLGPGPEVSRDGPADASAMLTADRQLRIGDILLSAGAGTLSGQPVRAFWMFQVAGWLLFAPASAFAAAHLFARREPDDGSDHHPWVLGAVGGLVLSSSSLVVWQVHNQNSASVLGLVLAPLAIAAVWRQLCHDEDRSPLLLAAVALAALIGTYGEYTPILAAVFGFVLLGRSPRRWPAAFGRAAIIGLATIAVAPLAFYRLVRVLFFLNGLDSDRFSAYGNDDVWLLFGRLTGVAWPAEGVTSRFATAAVVALLLIGIGAALTVHPGRVAWAGLAVGCGFTLWYAMGVLNNDYSHQRTVEIVQPLALLVATFGWFELLKRLIGGGHGQRALLGTGLVAVIVAGVAPASAGRSIHGESFLADRAVDGSYDDLADWVALHGAEGGSDVTALVSGYDEMLWATDALRDYADVKYPFLYPDYMVVTSFGDKIDRFVLVDSRALVDTVAPVLAANNRFRLYDTEGVAFTAVLPYRFGFHDADRSESDEWMWLERESELVVVRNDLAPETATLSVAALPQLAPITLTIKDEVDSWELEVNETPPETQQLVVPIGAQTLRLLNASVDRRPEQPFGGGDPRFLSVSLRLADGDTDG